MKLQDIKTKNEFYKVADTCYNRVLRLEKVWQNPSETYERKEKAFKLWGIMFKRVIKLSIIAGKINQVNLPKYESGGISSSKH